MPLRLPRLLLLVVAFGARPAWADESENPNTAASDNPAAYGWSRKLAADRCERASRFAARGDTALALGAYAEALRFDQTYGPAWLGFGQLRELVGDAKQAEYAYTRAADSPDSRPEALEARALLRQRAGRKSEALADLQAAAEVAPTPERLRALGQTFAAERAWAAALAAFRRLLTIVEPGSPAADAARVEVLALSRLAAETDPVRAGARGRGWIRRALAAAANRRSTAQGVRKLAP